MGAHVRIMKRRAQSDRPRKAMQRALSRGDAHSQSAASLSVVVPRQLEPLARTRPSAAEMPPFSPISQSSHSSVASPSSSRSLRRVLAPSPGTASDSLVPPASSSMMARRQSIAVQRQRSNVRRASSRQAMATSPTSDSRRKTSPQRKGSRSGVRGPQASENRNQLSGDEGERDDDDDEDEEDDSDGDARDGHEQLNMFDSRVADRLYRETQATAEYEDGGKRYAGAIDRRGITPFVTFTATETPPSQAGNRLLLDAKHKPSCGFCSGTNLVWVLKCAFCGCARMGDAPRLKYLIDMVLSVNPTITAQELAKRVLDFAKFDHVAMKVEEKFKQASLVRAKAAIMMMSRTINMLRAQTMRMIFNAWRGNNAIQASHDVIMHRLIKIKDIQVKARSKGQVFQMWKAYVERVVEERSQRYTLASRRNDTTRLRRIWMYWQTFMRIRAKEKLHELKMRHEAERKEAPNEYMKEIERLREALTETRRMVFAATNTMFDLLHESVRFADEDVQKVLQLKEMFPSTAGVFFESVYGHHILDGLSNGHIAQGDEFGGGDDASMDETLAKTLEDTRAVVDKMHPSESLIQWINFQRQRASAMAHAAVAAVKDNAANKAVAANVKPKVKDKKKDGKEIQGLQDLRTSISSPAVMLKLLCHASPEARTEYQRFRATESAALVAAITAENSTTSTTLTPAAQVQLKAYFKIMGRVLKLPPDIITKDAFVLNDFDSLYAYAVYLFTFHPNYIAPGLTLSPRYHLSFQFLAPQWEKIQKKLTEDQFDPFAQQQFYIFLAKIKRVNKQFVRFESICRAVDQIAQWHQLSTLRDTYNDFTRRALAKDSNISVALEKETLAAWVSLPTTKLLNLCENEDELRLIEDVFKDNVLELTKIFRIYGSGSGGKGILEQEFLKVMTRAGVTDKKNILRSHLQLIYQQARQAAPPPSAAGASSGSSPAISPAISAASSGDDVDYDGNLEDRGATPNEFFEAIVRVAHHNYQKRKVGQTDQASTAAGAATPSSFTPASPVGFVSSSTLLAQVTELVVDKITPLAKKFQEQGLMFKKQMVHPDVQYVCKAQEKRLKRAFLAYSQKNKNPSSRGKLMDLGDFETLLKDKRLVDALFPHGKIKQLVAFVQQDGDLSGGGIGLDSDAEFVFAEFVEALAAIAVFRNANPYLPLAKKLELFFEENF